MRLYTFVAALLAVFQTSTAHSIFTTLFVNAISAGDGVCTRMPHTPSNATYPINDLQGNEMACGYNGHQGVARVCSINACSVLGFEFREYADGSQPGAIDASHKGPCAVYIKAVESAIKDTAIGDGWFKIWEDGYNHVTQEWCTDRLIANNGLLSITLPPDLAGGYYLVRPELLALHQADKTPPNPQFYTGCAQIFLDSSGSGFPLSTVSIPGYLSIQDPAVLFNIYEPKWPYPMPGPSIAAINILEPGTPMVVKHQDEGLLDERAIVINANWWAVELEVYETEDGCWNASESCFSQLGVCYQSAPPTGSKGCRLWEAKCSDVQTQCKNGNFVGPPNKGMLLG